MNETLSSVIRPVASPIRVLVLVLGLVFAVEISIMLVFTAWPDLVRGDLARSVVDALTLTAVIAPALWLIIVRPLRAVFEERGLLLYRVFHSQERERAALARDLHDDVGQHLMVVLLGIRAAERADDLETARARLREVHAMAVRSADAVRRLARGLGPGALLGLGLVAALERLCEELSASSATKIELSTNLTSGARLEPDIEIACYRIVQESCTNVLRHAEARTARVSVGLEDETLTVEVQDDGRGFAAGAESDRGGVGLGLSGVRERAMSLGGRAIVTSRPGQGTRVRVEIPGVVVVGRAEPREVSP